MVLHLPALNNDALIEKGRLPKCGEVPKPLLTTYMGSGLDFQKEGHREYELCWVWIIQGQVDVHELG